MKIQIYQITMNLFLFLINYETLYYYNFQKLYYCLYNFLTKKFTKKIIRCNNNIIDNKLYLD